MKPQSYSLAEFEALEHKRKRGDLREDGYVFGKYQKNANSRGEIRVREIWRSTESMEKESNRARARMIEWRKIPGNNDRERKNSNKWRSENRGKYNAKKLEHYYKNKESHRSRQRRYYFRNKESILEKGRARTALTTSFNAQLPESVKNTIKTFYDCAKRVSKCTGIKHHVDHIVPIRLDGWHVPSNLQVIPERANIRKGQKTMIFAIDNRVDFAQAAPV